MLTIFEYLLGTDPESLVKLGLLGPSIINAAWQDVSTFRIMEEWNMAFFANTVEPFMESLMRHDAYKRVRRRWKQVTWG